MMAVAKDNLESPILELDPYERQKNPLITTKDLLIKEILEHTVHQPPTP